MPRLLVALVVVLAVTIALVIVATGGPGTVGLPSQRKKGSTTPELTVLCAAGLRKPAETCAATFTKETGIAVRFQFGGSGQLIGQLATGVPADLFLPADGTYLTIGREKKLLREAIPLAGQHPVLAVAAGNPKAIAGLDGLKPGLKYALASPEAASLGRTLQAGLGERWAALAAGAAVLKPTVTELLNDLQVGAVDAAIVWNATVTGMKNVQVVEDPALARLNERALATVVAASPRPTQALAFARWLASPEHGNPAWAAAGFTPVKGDSWALKPTLSLYSGSVNRVGIQATLKEFADREGAELTTIFNGCGILCATMKQMSEDKKAMPDAYYACDICFVAPVAAHFPEAVILTEADIVIAVPKGNPKRIKGLVDLAQPGLKLGIGNAMQSTLGYMTDRMLAAANLKDKVLANAVSQVPTGDLLINQLRTGSLDAAIVYNTNVKPQAEHLDTITLQVAGAKAMQPFAVGKDSGRAQLAQRLLEALRAGRDRSEAAGFRWRDLAPQPSASFPTDPADAHRP